MLVSVVTPSYNQAAFVEATLQSVLQQDYPQLEYIAVDGASSDGSAGIIGRYADRLAWSVSEPDGGQAEAINKGMRRAQGEIVAWLNSDDVLLPGAIQAAVQALDANPQAVLVYGDALSIDQHGRPFFVQRFAPFTVDDLLQFRIICQPTVFLRRSAWEEAGGLDVAYHYLLDHHLWLRLLAHGEAIYLPRLQAAARYHPQAKNLARAGDFGGEAQRILLWAAGQAHLGWRLSANRRAAQAGAAVIDARYRLDSGDGRGAFSAYLQALSWQPGLFAQVAPRLLLALLRSIGLRGLAGRYYRWRASRTTPLTIDPAWHNWPGLDVSFPGVHPLSHL